ncbi:MAG: phosphatidate cytidylyltransferase [Zoogloeaceae bacterium]|jgi:phosphatidate cytidylyltransferase|nr:phosphatidate cytidylyltransferase [Zoogloeaceae bacterium]
MLRTRIITALALLAVFLVTLFVLPKPYPAIVFAALAVLMGWEWTGLMSADRNGRFIFAAVILLSCLVIYRDFYPDFNKLWLLSAAFWLLLAPFWLRRGWRISGSFWKEIAGYLTGLIVIMPIWAAVTALQEQTPWWLLAVMGVVWVADISAYFAGRAWGRRKLAPAISPGKTWEGVAGAVLGVGLYCLIVGWAVGAPWTARSLIWAPAILLAVALSVVGDLFESMIKRQAGVKDSGRLLPGHGGFLDRLDSQTSLLPLAALIFFWEPA